MFTPGAPQQLKRDEHVCEKHVGDDEYLRGIVRDSIENEPDATGPCAVCEELGAPVDAPLDEIVTAVHKFFERAINSVPWDEGDWALPVIDGDDVLPDLGIDEDSPLFEVSRGELENDGPWIRINSGWPDDMSCCETLGRRSPSM